MQWKRLLKEMFCCHKVAKTFPLTISKLEQTTKANAVEEIVKGNVLLP